MVICVSLNMEKQIRVSQATEISSDINNEFNPTVTFRIEFRLLNLDGISQVDINKAIFNHLKDTKINL